MPSTALSERAARAPLAAHFPPHQVAAHLAHHCAEEVWQYGVDHDVSGRLAQYKPREELANAQRTCHFVIPSDDVWPAALADLGPDCPLGLWVRGHEQLPQLTARAVTGNRAASAEALARTKAPCASGHHDRCVSAGGPRRDDYAGTVTDRGGFVVAVIHYGPGQRSCRWLCPCPHPATGTASVDTPAAREKRTARQRRGSSVSDDQLTLLPGPDGGLPEMTATDGEAR